MYCVCLLLGFIKGAESIPVLIGVPITAFLNDSSHRYGRAGYYVCAAVAAISAILMFFVGHPNNGRQNLSKYSANGSINSHCTMPTSECPDLLNRSFSSGRYNNWCGQTPITTNGCPSSAGHQHFTPCTNGGGGVGGGAAAVATCHNGNHCQNGFGNGHGRLQKSLSFAFQNPAMWNDSYHPQQHHYTNGTNGTAHTSHRIHSR